MKILVSDFGGLLRFHYWQPQDLIPAACERSVRNFTLREWERYSDNMPYSKTCDNLPVHETIYLRAQELAGEGNHASALALFQRISEIEPQAKLNPVAETQRWERKAMALREMRQVTNLLAEKKYAEAMKQVDKVLGLDPEVDFYFQVNELCWDGTLNGQASRVLRACDIAVERSRGRKNGWMMRDNRGIARALTNNAAGAIEDFEYAIHNVDSIDSADFKVTRQSWVDALKAGNHPFSEELLNSLH